MNDVSNKVLQLNKVFNYEHETNAKMKSHQLDFECGCGKPG